MKYGVKQGLQGALHLAYTLVRAEGDNAIERNETDQIAFFEDEQIARACSAALNAEWGVLARLLDEEKISDADKIRPLLDFVRAQKLVCTGRLIHGFAPCPVHDAAVEKAPASSAPVPPWFEDLLKLYECARIWRETPSDANAADVVVAVDEITFANVRAFKEDLKNRTKAPATCRCGHPMHEGRACRAGVVWEAKCSCLGNDEDGIGRLLYETHYGKTTGTDQRPLWFSLSAEIQSDWTRTALRFRKDVLPSKDDWDDDKPDEWTMQIEAAHPSRSNSHDEYTTAMKMISTRHSKQALVALVNWLLVSRKPTLIFPFTVDCDRCSARITTTFSLEGTGAHAQAGAIASVQPKPKPIPLFITCPNCKTRHIDRGEFATKPHHTHACQGCGLTWRPAIEATVGVEFLPGFRDEPVFDGSAHFVVQGDEVKPAAIPCTCREIQANDPTRHFKGCALRKEVVIGAAFDLPAQHTMGAHNAMIFVDGRCSVVGCPYPNRILREGKIPAGAEIVLSDGTTVTTKDDASFVFVAFEHVDASGAA